MSLQVYILTPDGIFENIEAEELIIITSTGQIGVLNNHAPVITALDIGPIIIRRSGKWVALALIGGFAVVQDNKVTIIVNEAEAPTATTITEIEKALRDATDRLNRSTSDKETVEATLSFKRARALYKAASI